MIANRAPRAFTAAVLVSVALPLCVTSCAAASEFESRAAELRAANDSDVFEMPTERVYRISDFQLTAPEPLAAAQEAARVPLDYTGFILMTDDVITAAELRFDVAGLQQADFVLTEPALLRRVEGEVDSSPVTAVGLLSFDGATPREATVTIRPVTVDDDIVELDAGFAVPTELLPTQAGGEAGEISARIELAFTD